MYGYGTKLPIVDIHSRRRATTIAGVAGVYPTLLIIPYTARGLDGDLHILNGSLAVSLLPIVAYKSTLNRKPATRQHATPLYMCVHYEYRVS